MVGRQMMGRIDSRFKQGCAGRPTSTRTLGGLSCVCVGDPAQCEALFDQQIYDIDVHRDTPQDSPSESSFLSNVGMQVYDEFDDVIILSTVHRLRQINKPNLTQEEKAYNERAQRFLHTLHQLRDLTWTIKDYYWLCQRKRINLAPSTRGQFQKCTYPNGLSTTNRRQPGK